MNLGHSTFRLFLSKGGNAILFFVGIAYFTRHLNSTEMGSYFLFLAMLGLTSILADFGMRGALEKRLSEGSNSEKMLSSALAFKLLMISVIAVAIFLARGYINQYLGAELALLLAVGVTVREFFFFYIGALRGDFRVAETATIRFVVRFLWMSIGAVLVSVGFGPEGPIIGLVIGMAFGFVWATYKLDIAITRPSLTHTRSLVDFSKYNTITSVGGRFYQWIDVAIIGFLLSQRHVSAYEVSWQITLLVLMLSKSISLAIFPQISRWDAESAKENIGNVVSKAGGVVLFISVPALVGAGLYASEMLHFFFGSEYTFAATVLVVLMVEKLIQSFNDIVEASVRAIDRPDLAAKATAISMGLNLVLNPILIVTVGLVGAAIATAVTGFVNTVLHTRYLSRFVAVDIPYRLVGWYVLASLVMGGSLFVVKSFVPVTGLVELVAEIGLGATIYLVISSLIPEVRERVLMPGVEVLGAQIVPNGDQQRWRF